MISLVSDVAKTRADEFKEGWTGMEVAEGETRDGNEKQVIVE
jgi:hypothetical protein